MKQFALPESTAIHVAGADFTPRKNGKRKVPSVRLDVSMLIANTVLDQIWPGLRQRFYDAASGEEVQRELDGVEPLSDTPLLRFANMKPIRFKDQLSGYRAAFDLGIGRRESAVELTSCTLDKFEADMRQGGAVALRFRISSEGLKEREIGKLGILVDCDTGLILEPPAVQDPLTGIDAPPGEATPNTNADVVEDTRHRKAGKPSGVSRIQRKISAAAKKKPAAKKTRR